MTFVTYSIKLTLTRL